MLTLIKRGNHQRTGTVGGNETVAPLRVASPSPQWAWPGALGFVLSERLTGERFVARVMASALNQKCEQAAVGVRDRARPRARAGPLLRGGRGCSGFSRLPHILMKRDTAVHVEVDKFGTIRQSQKS